MSGKERRSVFNMKSHRGGRLRLLAPFLAMLAAIALFALSMHNMINVIATEMSVQLAGTTVLEPFQRLIAQIQSMMFGGVCLITLLTLTLWAYYSFRIFGPHVAIQRHVEALRDGRYDSRVRLRKGDEFTELADRLNELAERLQSRDRA